MKKFTKLQRVLASATLLLSMGILAGCGGQATTPKSEEKADQPAATNQVVNLYTDRHYETDDALYKKFTDATGIKVNVVKGKSDELIERLKREGKDTQADLLITADAGRLHRAKEQSLLQPVNSEVLNNSIPEKFRDPGNEWFGLTVRARVIAYAKDRVKPEQITSYDDLTKPEWKGKILVRSSSNIYNQSFLASLIEINGEDKAKAWAQGVLANMARQPEGGDTDQMTAVAAGVGDLAITNTYYYGRLLASDKPEEKKIAEGLGLIFPDQNGSGTHINVSGIGLAKESKNNENAIKFMEFLASDEAQKQFAETNHEFPVNPQVESSELLKSWGEFKTQDINLAKLGELNAQAVKIYDAIGWK